LLPGAQRDHPARLSQYGGGRAAGRPRNHAGARAHSGRRDPDGAHPPVRPRQSRGSVPRHRPPAGARPARSAGPPRLAPRQTQAHPMAALLYPQTGPRASLRRVGAMVLRHWYVIHSSLPRAAELVFWPLVSMLMWGFLQTYLARATSLAAHAASLLVGGVLL